MAKKQNPMWTLVLVGLVSATAFYAGRKGAQAEVIKRINANYDPAVGNQIHDKLFGPG